MDKLDKQIVLNSINGELDSLQRMLPYLHDSCKKHGLQSGKLAINDSIKVTCRNLAHYLEIYMNDDFKLDDMQDYK
jgi:hypothetical protein